MNRLGNVLLVDTDRAAAEALAERLRRSAYHVTAVRRIGEADASARAERPDLVLAAAPEDGTALDLVQALKTDSETADIPVLLLVPEVTAAIAEEALAAGVDDTLARGCEDAELLARLRPLVRLSVMQCELRQRALIARGFGVAARDRVSVSSGDKPAVLVVGDRLDEMTRVLGGDCALVSTDCLYEAEDHLTRRNFDAAVLAFRDPPEEVLGFCSQVRNNPRLFNLPMVLLAGGAMPPAEAYRRGATRVVPSAPDAGVLRAAVLTLVRRQQLRWAIRQALFDSLSEATREPETGLYDTNFLRPYLEARLAAAKSQKRHLSLIFFAVPNVESVRRQFGDDAALHLSQQLGQWITGLLRAEDLTARPQTNEFCVVLPDTPLGEAEVVMHRIAGVLAYTDFAVREVYQPVKVWVEVSCADVQADDDFSSFVWRARRNLG